MLSRRVASYGVLAVATVVAYRWLTAKKRTTVRRNSKTEPYIKYTPERIKQILADIAEADFEILSDLAHFAQQLPNTSPGILARTLLSPEVQESLRSREHDSLAAHRIKDAVKFAEYCLEQSRKNADIAAYIDGLDAMFDDALHGVLPVLPFYNPDIFPSTDTVLEFIAKLNRHQRAEAIRVINDEVESEGFEACQSWLCPEGVRPTINPPPRVAAKIAECMRTCEVSLLIQSEHLLGSKVNFRHVLATYSRDQEFATQLRIVKELNNAQMVDDMVNFGRQAAKIPADKLRISTGVTDDQTSDPTSQDPTSHESNWVQP